MKASQAIGIAISMDAGANNIEFGKAIDTKLKELKQLDSCRLKPRPSVESAAHC